MLQPSLISPPQIPVLESTTNTTSQGLQHKIHSLTVLGRLEAPLQPVFLTGLLAAQCFALSLLLEVMRHNTEDASMASRAADLHARTQFWSRLSHFRSSLPTYLRCEINVTDQTFYLG